MDDFIVPDDSEEEVVSKKRKRQPSTKSGKNSKSRSASKSQSPPKPPSDDEEEDLELPSASTAQQWTYDPDNVAPAPARPTASSTQRKPTTTKKQKPHMSEPDKRYTWLANITDADRNPPGHPDYDPRTIFIPPLAWRGFSPFEKQYWEIKQKFWDTIVFLKKSKFYELYENDATIGHQFFDLKLTDRVNMR